MSIRRPEMAGPRPAQSQASVPSGKGGRWRLVQGSPVAPADYEPEQPEQGAESVPEARVPARRLGHASEKPIGAGSQLGRRRPRRRRRSTARADQERVSRKPRRNQVEQRLVGGVKPSVGFRHGSARARPQTQPRGRARGAPRVTAAVPASLVLVGAVVLALAALDWLLTR